MSDKNINPHMTTANAPQTSNQDLRILSWNIHDSNDRITGSKLTDETFIATISQCDIICLQETKRSLKIPGFKCLNSNRVDSRSGGLCIGFKHELRSHITPVNTKNFSSDIQAIRISRRLCDCSKDILLVNVYDSLVNSSYKQKLMANGTYEATLETLGNFLDCHRGENQLMLCGDFNARTGNENSICIKEDVMQDSLSSGNFLTTSDLPARSDRFRCSQDDITNNRGRALLELATMHNAKIINGATIGDALGEYTCINYRGQSVVDYFLTSHELLQKVSSLRLQDLTSISDHRPLVCQLSAPSLSSLRCELKESDFESAPNGFKWKRGEKGSAQQFKRGQNNPSIVARLNQLCSQTPNPPEDVYTQNSKLITIIHDVAANTLERKKVPSDRKHYHNKASWFDMDCRKAKRKMNKLAKRASKIPTKENRDTYYMQKKEYRKLLKKKKGSFFAKLNRRINEERTINWTEFKRLRSFRNDPHTMDLQDLVTFYEFFKDLYAQKALPDELTTNLKDAYTDCINSQQTLNHLDDTLNRFICQGEVTSCIQKLKLGKASADDCLTNEFLKNSSPLLLKCITKVFNACLDNGVYPWNVALVTPLHKKGDKYNPDNYRAIAVGSNLGKLFANILLDRLIMFRNHYFPDPINQLGFCKNAQTSDHIFTLNTCIQKQLQKGEYLFSCFIDFRKAFDTVCREALLYKLSNLGVNGKFFDCLRHMYTNSKAKIKLINKVSDAIDVLVGTEQGHPMSPELFKIYLLELSELLDTTYNVKAPLLNARRVTHLLWADDLVLLALDKESLQRLLDSVHKFCSDWGLTVNMSKTATLVFNKSGKQLKVGHGLRYGNVKVQSAREYSYLGIIYTLSGSFSKAQKELRTKGLRAYFSLKRMVDINSLTVASLYRLFDSLIQPIITYGCQVWLLDTNYLKMVANNTLQLDPRNVITKISNDPFENLHLKFLKWTLGLSTKAINLVCWGDSGRFPIAVSVSKQVLSYAKRLEILSMRGTDQTLAGNAFIEQRNLGLPWYSRLLELKVALHMPNTINPSEGRVTLQNQFLSVWESALPLYSKLTFYAMVKNKLGFEEYLTIQHFNKRRCLAKLRASNHNLNCETGRYLSLPKKGSLETPADSPLSQLTIWRKCCKICSDPTAEGLSNLPFFEPIIEDEQHFLVSCPQYHSQRLALEDNVKSALLSWESNRLMELFQKESVTVLAKYVLRLMNVRFPKQDHGIAETPLSDRKKKRKGKDS